MKDIQLEKDRKWRKFTKTENEEYPYLNLISFHHSIAISSYQLGEKAENERYTTLKGLKMKDICQNKEINIHILIWYPFLIPLQFLFINCVKKAENERYTTLKGLKMKDTHQKRKWKISVSKKERYTTWKRTEYEKYPPCHLQFLLSN